MGGDVFAEPSKALRGLASASALDCCSGCSDAYCSPQSGNCYGDKGKSYYLYWPSASPSPPPASYQYADCCDGCYTDYCSPSSGGCYDSKAKSYYLTCSR